MEPSWTCVQCGHLDNLQTFCTHCGSARPAAAATPTVGPWMSAPVGPGPSTPPLAAPPLAAPPLAAPVSAPTPLSSPSGPVRLETRSAGADVPDIPVLPGEAVLVDERFTPHLILKNLTSRIMLTDRRLVVQHPHALFGLIPMGYSLQSAPLHEINQVHFGHLMRSRHVAFGVGSVLWGLAMLFMGLGGSPVFALIGLVMVGVGACLIITSRVVGISADTGGHLRLHASGRGGDVARASEVGNRIVTQLDQIRSRP